LDAAVQVIRAKGYSAMTIDDVCLAAGLTKGSFFHHFKSKEELALAPLGILRRWRTACLHRLAIAVCMIPWSAF
jgi:Bacterial regulatory proteins, tetR family